MPAAVVRIPRLLADVGDGRTEIPVQADTVAAAMGPCSRRFHS
jgi:hypothetical protein